MPGLVAAPEGESPPRVSVVMSVYNGEAYLHEAIDSILAQTYTDFELLIIDDGSTDGSADIVGSFTDPRIRLVTNDQNRGLTISLNRAFLLARGEYIARMDADDICVANRLARQVDFLDRNLQIGVCGSWVKTVKDGREVSVDRYPLDHEEIKSLLLFDSALAHPTVLIRKEILEKLEFCYDESYSAAQDYELWVRLSRRVHLANIPAILVVRRLHPGQITRSRSKAQQITRCRIYARQLGELGIFPNAENERLHQALQSFRFSSSVSFLREVDSWLGNLLEMNMHKSIYPEGAFARLCRQRWCMICDSASELGLLAWKEFRKSSLLKCGKLPWKQRIRLFVKCLLKWDTQGEGRFWRRIGLFH